MKSILSVLLFAVAAVNAVGSARFDGCEYKSLGVKAWDNCKGACKQFDCYTACHRVGSKDRASDYVSTADLNGDNSCSCKCYYR